MSIEDGGYAFPCLDTDRGWVENRNGVNVEFQHHSGMSLRDYFAAKALAHPATHDREAVDTKFKFDDAARWAYAVADAMLRARKEAR